MKGVIKKQQELYWSRRISCSIQKFNSRTTINKVREISAFQRQGDEAFRDQVDEHGELPLED